MLARSATIFKWTLYALAALLVMAVQGILQRVTIWGVIPFLYPAIAAIPATFEESTPGTAFALAVGVMTDLLVPGPIPCFYTLIFPLAGLCAAAISKSLLRTGILCSLVAAAAAFLLTDFFFCLLLWLRQRGAWNAGGWLALRETAVTLPFCLPLHGLFHAVYRRVHQFD